MIIIICCNFFKDLIMCAFGCSLNITYEPREKYKLIKSSFKNTKSAPKSLASVLFSTTCLFILNSFMVYKQNILHQRINTKK